MVSQMHYHLIFLNFPWSCTNVEFFFLFHVTTAVVLIQLLLHIFFRSNAIQSLIYFFRHMLAGFSCYEFYYIHFISVKNLEPAHTFKIIIIIISSYHNHHQFLSPLNRLLIIHTLNTYTQN